MANTTRKTRKTETAPAADANVIAMAVAHEVDPGLVAQSDDALLASMLDEIIEEPVSEAAPVADHEIEAVAAEIEKAESNAALYAGDDAAPVTSASDTPATTDIADKGKKGKGKGKKAAAAPKEPSAPRITYVGHSAGDVLKAKLGDKADEMLLLEVGDIELPADELKKKQDALLALISHRPGTGDGGSTQKKVAEKVVMLFNWMMRGGSLNEVMARTFKVLARDGEITSGDKGNLHAELLSKPYSVGTCRAQAGQMMAMLPMLKIATKDGKGKLVANPDSLIFMKAKAELGLT